MKVFSVITIFALSAISFTTGLKCYTCVYEDEMPGSQDDCEANPSEKYLMTCPEFKSSSHESTQSSQIGHIFTKSFEKPTTSPRALYDPICITATAEVSGKKHVERACFFAHKEEDLNGVCETAPDMGEIKNITACFCTSDGCNGGEKRGIKCYNCNYGEDMVGSQDDCKTSPPEHYLQTCPVTMSLSDRTTHVDKIRNAIFKLTEKPGTSPKEIGEDICLKMTAEIDGMERISRSCYVALSDRDLDGTSHVFPDTCIDGVCLKKLKQYYCTKDNCNSGVSLVSLPILVISSLGLLTIYVKN